MATSLEILLSPWPAPHLHHHHHQQHRDPSLSPRSPPSSPPASKHHQRNLYYHYQQALQASFPNNQYRNRPGTTAYDLEQRSITLAEFLVRRRWCHPDVAGFEDLIASSSQADENSDQNGEDDDDDDEADEQPDALLQKRSLTYQPLNICVNLDEPRAVASVWLLSRIGRFSSSSAVVEYEETVTVLHWWRRGRAWECFRQGGTKVIGS